jgi:5-methylcytosine-specific restriction protein A
MTARRRVSTKERLALFQRECGKCHLCGGIVQAGEAWDLSHEIPLALGGADDASNWKVAHRKCHKAETAEKDIPNIARAKRREALHLGAKRAPEHKIKSAPMPVRPPQRKASTPPAAGSKLAQTRALGSGEIARRYGAEGG